MSIQLHLFVPRSTARNHENQIPEICLERVIRAQLNVRHLFGNACFLTPNVTMTVRIAIPIRTTNFWTAMIGDGFEMSLFASSENTDHGWDLGT